MATQLSPQPPSPQTPQADPQGLPRSVRSFLFGRRRVWTILMIGLLMAGGAVAWVEYPHHPVLMPVRGRYPQTTLAMRSPGKLRVLFLGNSLTQYNGGLATFLEQLAASAKTQPTPVFDELTKFGATWAQLWDVTDARNLIHQGGWDFVVLQDYSTAAMIYGAEMTEYGRRFSNAARSVGATPIFFMTWPHADEPRTLMKIAATYVGLAKDNHGITAPVALAWKKSMDERPQIVLYDMRENPAKHPTPEGTYLTACVFYSVLFNKSPVGLTGRIVEGTRVYVDLSPSVAKYLQQVAWDTVSKSGSIASTKPATRPTTKPANKFTTGPTKLKPV